MTVTSWITWYSTLCLVPSNVHKTKVEKAKKRKYIKSCMLHRVMDRCKFKVIWKLPWYELWSLFWFGNKFPFEIIHLGNEFMKTCHYCNFHFSLPYVKTFQNYAVNCTPLCNVELTCSHTRHAHERMNLGGFAGVDYYTFCSSAHQ